MWMFFIYIKNSLTIQENLDFTSFRQDSWRRKNKNPLSYPHYPQYPRQIWWITGLFSFFSTLCYDGRNGKRWPGGAENGGKDEVRDGVGV